MSRSMKLIISSLGGTDPTAAYIFDVSNPDYVVYLPAMADGRTKDSACGLVTRQNGDRDIVLAGGRDGYYGISRSFILSLESLTWRDGPDLPQGLGNLGETQLENTFLVVGGVRNRRFDVYSNKIYKFDEVNDDWITLPAEMSYGGGIYSAFLVSDESVIC